MTYSNTEPTPSPYTSPLPHTWQGTSSPQARLWDPVSSAPFPHRPSPLRWVQGSPSQSQSQSAVGSHPRWGASVWASHGTGCWCWRGLGTSLPHSVEGISLGTICSSAQKTSLNLTSLCAGCSSASIITMTWRYRNIDILLLKKNSNHLLLFVS